MHLLRDVNETLEEMPVKNRLWSACAGAVAMLMLLPGAPASAQQKSEVTLSRQPGIFYMPSHIMEKNKLI